MEKNRVLLIIQSVLCALTALALIVADLAVYFEGVALKEADPMESIYSTEAIAGKAFLVLPILFVSVIFTVVCAVLGVRDKSIESPAMKIDIKKNPQSSALSVTALRIIRAVGFTAAVIMILAGIFNGSLMDVLIKATKICTECIGLG